MCDDCGAEESASWEAHEAWMEAVEAGRVKIRPLPEWPAGEVDDDIPF